MAEPLLATSVFDRLLKDRIIWLGSEVRDENANEICANRDRHGRTFTGNTRPGQQNWVYRRERRPCRRCGTPIRRAELGATETSERIVFWCPVCQT